MIERTQSYTIFFLMIRRPPRSTLFPYTTPLPISRASHKQAGHDRCLRSLQASALSRRRLHAGGDRAGSQSARSEEHTSELQSRQYLVCRLLLEKKKRIARRPSSLLTSVTPVTLLV